MDRSMIPAPGGGIVPQSPPVAVKRLHRVLVGASSLLPRLPEPVLHRLLLRGQRSTRPPTQIAQGIPIVEDSHDGVPTTWLAPELGKEGAVVFLHGGAYQAGPGDAQWAWLAEIQRRTGMAAAMILYRMPPTHPFPAALDDAVASLRAMCRDGRLTNGRWILGGDSAGGGLALAAAQVLRDGGDPLPAGLLLTAPWVDIEMEHPDVLADQRQMFVNGRAVLRWSAERYANGVPLADPRLSPINGAMKDLPPVHVNVGTNDPFLADIRRLRRALEAAGVPATSIEQEGGAHTYPQQIATPEAEWTIRSQARWIRDRIGTAASTSEVAG